MRYYYLIFIFIFSSCQLPSKNLFSKESEYLTYFKKKEKKPIALVGVNVIPIKSDGVVSNQIVFIESGRVKDIIRSTDRNIKKIPSRYQIVDGRGKYLIPGLVDTHVHIGFLGGIQDALLELDLFIANGVTAVRNMGGSPLTLELRKQIQEGIIIGPQILTTGPIYNGAQAYKGSNRADWCFRDSKPEKCAILTKEFARQRVIKDKKAGYDWIKSREYLSRDIYLALYEESQRQGIDIVGHYPEAIDYKDFFKRRYQRSIDHIYHLDRFVSKNNFPLQKNKEDELAYIVLGLRYFFKDLRKEKELLSTFSKSGVYFVPTLSLENNLVREIKDGGYSKEQKIPFFSVCKLQKLSERNSFYTKLQKWQDFKGKNYVRLGYEATQKFVYNAWKSGTPIAVGSDTNAGAVVSGVSTHDEIEVLSKTGIPNQEVLKAATMTSAQLLKLKNVGFIEPGVVADLVLLDENPLEKISATRKIRGVFTSGHYYDYEEIQHSLKQVQKAYDKQECK